MKYFNLLLFQLESDESTEGYFEALSSFNFFIPPTDSSMLDIAPSIWILETGSKFVPPYKN